MTTMIPDGATPLRLAIKKVPPKSTIPPYSYLFDSEVSAEQTAKELKGKTVGYWYRHWSSGAYKTPRNYVVIALFPILEPVTNEWGEVAP